MTAHDKLTSQRMNDIIKTLTVFSVIVLPLTAIGGFFGMNVPFPYQDEWYSTVIILALMIVLSLGMLQYFRMKHWL